MQFRGKVIADLGTSTGQGRQGTWTRHEFVLEYEDPQTKWKTPLRFNYWGEMPNGYRIGLGDELEVNYTIASREWQGKWFTEATALDLIVVARASQGTDQTPDPRDLDDLPF